MVLRFIEKCWRALRVWEPLRARYQRSDEVDVKSELKAPMFPEHCLRGLRESKNLITIASGKALVDTTAFLPDYRTAESNGHGWVETSINWEDDDGATQMAFSARQQAEYGAARLPLSEIERIAATNGGLRHERKQTTVGDVINNYHGNLLYDPSLPKSFHKMVASALALASAFLPPPWGKK